MNTNSLPAKAAAMAQLSVRLQEISRELAAQMTEVKKLPTEFRAIYG